MGDAATEKAPVTDVREAIRIAKDYVVYALSDEQLTSVGGEETEFNPHTGMWKITVGFYRPWSTPRTRAQELLDQLGSATQGRRSYKVVELSADGVVHSMKDRRD